MKKILFILSFVPLLSFSQNFNFSAKKINVSDSAWSLLGNANTDDSINFLGTTNLQDLILKSNNLEGFRIYKSKNVSVGLGGHTFNGQDNISIGKSNTIDGFNNYLLGERNILNLNNFVNLLGSGNTTFNVNGGNIIGNRNTIDILSGSNITGFNSTFLNTDNSNITSISGDYNTIVESNLFGQKQSIYNTKKVSALGNQIIANPVETLTTGSLVGNFIDVNNSLDKFGLFGNNITVDATRDAYAIGQNLILTNNNNIDIGLNDASKVSIDGGGRLTLRGSLAPSGDDGVLGDILVSQGPNVAPIWTATNNITGVAKVVNISSAGYTVLANDEVIRLASGFTGTVTMPLASASYDATTSKGRMITIVNHSAGNRQTSISYQTGSVTATTTIPNNTEIKLMFNGTIWFLISN